MPNDSWLPYEDTIEFFRTAVKRHVKVSSVFIRSDQVYEIHTENHARPLVVLIVDLYTVGQADIVKAMGEVEDLDILVTVSTYNGYTRAAEEYAKQNRIGVYQINEFLGAIWKREFWDYVKHDENGQAVTHYHG